MNHLHVPMCKRLKHDKPLNNIAPCLIKSEAKHVNSLRKLKHAWPPLPRWHIQYTLMHMDASRHYPNLHLRCIPACALCCIPLFTCSCIIELFIPSIPPIVMPNSVQRHSLVAVMYVPALAVDTALSSNTQHTWRCQIIVNGHGGRQMGWPLSAAVPKYKRNTTTKAHKTCVGCSLNGKMGTERGVGTLCL